MSRNPLWSLVALGGLVSALSGVGVVAVFSDTALTGTNDVTSGQQPHLALQIATAHDDARFGVICDVFTDDVGTGLYVATNFQPGDSIASDICLKNTFSGSVSVTVRAFDVVDVDRECTNDEAMYDATCPVGLDRNGETPGELSQLLNVTFQRLASCAGSPASTTVAWLADLASAPAPLGNFAAGEVSCFITFAKYSPGATYDQRQAAQTDQVTWRFAFDSTE